MADELLVVVCFQKADLYPKLSAAARENWLIEDSRGVVYGPFDDVDEAKKELVELDEKHSCDGPHLIARLEAPYVGRVAIAEHHVVEFSASGYGLQHPLRCRPDLIGCHVNRYLAGLDGPEKPPGRYVVVLAPDEEEHGRWRAWYQRDPDMAPSSIGGDR